MTTEARRLTRARLMEAGATLSTAVYEGRVHLTAWLPDGTPDEVVAAAMKDGWLIVLGRPYGWHLVKPPESRQDARRAREVVWPPDGLKLADVSVAAITGPFEAGGVVSISLATPRTSAPGSPLATNGHLAPARKTPMSIACQNLASRPGTSTACAACVPRLASRSAHRSHLEARVNALVERLGRCGAGSGPPPNPPKSIVFWFAEWLGERVCK